MDEKEILWTEIRQAEHASNQILLWEVTKLVSTTELSTMAAWYYLNSKGELFIVILLLAFSTLLLSIFGVMARKYSALTKRCYRALIADGNMFLAGESGAKKPPNTTSLNHITKLPMYCITANAFMFLYSAISSSVCFS